MVRREMASVTSGGRDHAVAADEAERRGIRTAFLQLTCFLAPAIHGLGRSALTSAGDEIIASARQGKSGNRPSVTAAIEPPSERPRTVKERYSFPSPTRASTTAFKSRDSSAPNEYAPPL